MVSDSRSWRIFLLDCRDDSQETEATMTTSFCVFFLSLHCRYHLQQNKASLNSCLAKMRGRMFFSCGTLAVIVKGGERLGIHHHHYKIVCTHLQSCAQCVHTLQCEHPDNMIRYFNFFVVFIGSGMGVGGGGWEHVPPQNLQQQECCLGVCD